MHPAVSPLQDDRARAPAGVHIVCNPLPASLATKAADETVDIFLISI